METAGKFYGREKSLADQEISVTSTDGHIRYDYTREKDQPYEGDIAVECYEQKSVLVD